MNRGARWLVIAAVVYGQTQVAWAGAPTVVIDSDGCEHADGYAQVNNCNSAGRPDGKTFKITHNDMAFETSGTGSTAYAALFCAGAAGSHLLRTGIVTGKAYTCSGGAGGTNFASRSICGSTIVCTQKP